MNMAKPGTVSAVGNYFHLTGNPRKYRACGMTRYTLCEYQGGKRRNSSRNGFAFYILAISRRSPGGTLPVLSPGFYVIPGQTPMSRTHPANPRQYGLAAVQHFALYPETVPPSKPENTPQTLASIGLQADFLDRSKLFRLRGFLPVCPVSFRRLP